MRKTPAMRGSQVIPLREIQNRENRMGTQALNRPKTIAPVVLASIRRRISIGATSSLSKDWLLRSKVIVTASIEVVPKRMDMAITPGRILRISTSVLDLRRNIRVQAKGKMIPQLIFGGLK